MIVIDTHLLLVRELRVAVGCWLTDIVMIDGARRLLNAL
jgi:hypothetical protein